MHYILHDHGITSSVYGAIGCVHIYDLYVHLPFMFLCLLIATSSHPNMVFSKWTNAKWVRVTCKAGAVLKRNFDWTELKTR